MLKNKRLFFLFMCISVFYPIAGGQKLVSPTTGSPSMQEPEPREPYIPGIVLIHLRKLRRIKGWHQNHNRPLPNDFYERVAALRQQYHANRHVMFLLSRITAQPRIIRLPYTGVTKTSSIIHNAC